MAAGPATSTPEIDFSGSIRKLVVQADADLFRVQAGEQFFLAADMPAAVAGAVQKGPGRCIAISGLRLASAHASAMRPAWSAASGGHGVKYGAQGEILAGEQALDLPR